MKNYYDRRERKLFESMGPWNIYMKLALLTFYTPYWRKVCRMLCKMRTWDRVDFRGECHNRMIKYALAAYKDTKLPDLVKYTLRGCVQEEFKFEIDPK